MARVLKPRKVDAKTKEVIALVVAAINNCDFCLHAHAGNLRGRYGFDDEGVAEILKTIALWSEVTRFNIAAGVRWPQPVEATLSAEEAAWTRPVSAPVGAFSGTTTKDARPIVAWRREAASRPAAPGCGFTIGSWGWTLGLPE
jgi:AhpD family alkylhydroperoxidase